jgi:osmotically-inducible protein OsmY
MQDRFVTRSPEQERLMISSSQIEANVLERLHTDKRVPAPDEIAVEAVGGAVTLRGTVGSLAQRHAAVRNARAVPGVFDVHDEIKVRILDEHARKDAEIRGAAIQRLIWDAEVPSDSIEVTVKDGWVTLKGEVDHQFQSNDAFEDVSKLYGVVGVTNRIRVVEEL